MSRRLPTLHPSWTDDEGEYIYKWESLGKRLAVLLGGTLTDYDPSFVIEFASDGHNPIGRRETISLQTGLYIVNLTDQK
jgi:hypothetical protein